MPQDGCLIAFNCSARMENDRIGPKSIEPIGVPPGMSLPALGMSESHTRFDIEMNVFPRGVIQRQELEVLGRMSQVLQKPSARRTDFE